MHLFLKLGIFRITLYLSSVIFVTNDSLYLIGFSVGIRVDKQTQTLRETYSQTSNSRNVRTIEIANTRYSLGIPDHFNVRLVNVIPVVHTVCVYSTHLYYTVMYMCTLYYSYIRYICVLLHTGM